MTEVCEGDIVAAPFDSDSLWYRAEVSAVNDNKVDLYYGDFGDSCWVARDRIRLLRLESCFIMITVKTCNIIWAEIVGMPLNVFADFTNSALILRTVFKVGPVIS